MTPIERAARAIAEYYCEDPDAVDDVPGSAHKKLARWRCYAPVAAAVFETLREPTEEMIRAGEAWQDHCTDVDSLFGEMVYAALYPDEVARRRNTP